MEKDKDCNSTTTTSDDECTEEELKKAEEFKDKGN